MRKRRKYLVARGRTLWSGVRQVKCIYHDVNGMPLLEALDGELLAPSNYIGGLVNGNGYTILFREVDRKVIAGLEMHDKLMQDLTENDLNIGSKEQLMIEYSNALVVFLLESAAALVGIAAIGVLVVNFAPIPTSLKTLFAVACIAAGCANAISLVLGLRSKRLYDRTGRWVDVQTGVTNLNGFMKRDGGYIGNVIN